MSNFISSFVKNLKRKRPQLRPRARLGRLESLENRRLLASDLAAVAGDSNGDGVFGSADIVSVFQAGKFETNQAATFAQGDWNGDGFFNSSDIVYAFQAAKYEQAKALSADDAGDSAGEGEADQGENGRDRDAQQRHRQRHQQHRQEHRRHRLEHLMEGLAAGIESGDLPGNLTAEDAQGILDGLAAAIEGGDAEAVRELVGQVREALQIDKLEAKIEKLQTTVNEAAEAGEDTVGGLPVADVQAAIDSASASLAAGNTDAAGETLAGLRQARAEARRVARMENAIRGLQEALDEATTAGEETLYGLPVTDVQAAITAASESLAAGELAAAREALSPVVEARRDAARAERAAARIQGTIDRLQTAVDAATEAGEDVIRGVAVADIQTAITSASEALAAGDLDAAREALSSIRPERGDRDGRPNGRPGDRRNHGDNGRNRPGGDQEGEGDTDADQGVVGGNRGPGGNRVPPRAGRPG